MRWQLSSFTVECGLLTSRRDQLRASEETSSSNCDIGCVDGLVHVGVVYRNSSTDCNPKCHARRYSRQIKRLWQRLTGGAAADTARSWFGDTGVVEQCTARQA